MARLCTGAHTSIQYTHVCVYHALNASGKHFPNPHAKMDAKKFSKVRVQSALMGWRIQLIVLSWNMTTLSTLHIDNLYPDDM